MNFISVWDNDLNNFCLIAVESIERIFPFEIKAVIVLKSGKTIKTDTNWTTITTRLDYKDLTV